MKNDDTIFIYGKHALKEALNHRPDAVREIFFSDGLLDQEIKEKAKSLGLKISVLDHGNLPRGINENTVHQGVVARVSSSALVHEYSDFIKNLTIDSDTSVLVLGEIEDPQNVGAVIRSAAAFGVSAVLIPEHNQAPINGTVIKVSAGMAFRVPLVSIGNVNTTLRDLKKRGFWVYGLAGDMGQSIQNEIFDKPTVFVLGNEAKGLREKTRDACDILLSIPMSPTCESLNAAAGTAIALYAWSIQHPPVSKK